MRTILTDICLTILAVFKRRPGAKLLIPPSDPLHEKTRKSLRDRSQGTGEQRDANGQRSAPVTCLQSVVGWLAIMTFGFSQLGPAQTLPPLAPALKFSDCHHCPEMVTVPPGMFLMGSTDEELAQAKAALGNPLYRWFFSWTSSYQQPKHHVSIQRSFALGRYMVTRAELSAFIQATGYQTHEGCKFENERRASLHVEGSWDNPGFAQSDRDPVVCVNIADTEAYIAWLNAQVIHEKASAQPGPYRLPSETEWEFAARAGTITQRWWGDQLGVGNADCDGCGSRWDGLSTAPVDHFPDNPFGISGVLGNAFEWVSDCWNSSYVSAPVDESRWATGDCSLHPIRGDGLFSTGGTLRSAVRSRAPIVERSSSIGFRVARSLASAN